MYAFRPTIIKFDIVQQNLDNQNRIQNMVRIVYNHILVEEIQKTVIVTEKEFQLTCLSIGT